MRSLNIFTKLFISHTAIGLFVIVILSTVFYLFLRNAIIGRTVDQLSSINILEKDLIEMHLLDLQRDMEGLQKLNIFIDLYQPDRLTGKSTSQLQEDGHMFDELLKLHGFAGIWLYDSSQQLLFSMHGESLAANLLTPIDSVGRSYPGQLRIIDASADAETQTTLLFFRMPVSGNDRMLGSIIAQVDFERIQNILMEHTGMGSSGESYLVADDYRMRSASRFMPDKKPLATKVETEAVRRALSGSQHDAKPYVVTDYRGIEVLSAYQRLSIPGLNWVILSEMDMEEAMMPIIGLRNSLIGVTILLMLVAMLITYVVSKAIAKPVLQLKDIVVSLAEGVIPQKRPAVRSNDEIGHMGDAINQLTEALRRSTAFASAIGSGQFDTPYKKLGENDSLGTALISMRDELLRANENEQQLAKSRAAALLEGQEVERRRITLDLHDGVGQLLTAIRMRVEMLEGNEERKEAIKSQINETIAEVKRISYNVMPHALVDYGLKAALEGLCDHIRRYSSLSIDFTYVEEVQKKLDFDVSIAIFRIAQEGLNNILKHAGADRVELHLVINGDHVYLILTDNGQGFNADDVKNMNQGFGLRNMRERARLLGGIFEIHSSRGEGTVVEVSIPFTTTKPEA